MIRRLAFIALAISVSARSSHGADTPAAAGRPLKALLVAGGCCHDYPQQKKILSDGISARANVVWTIVHEGDNREHRVSIYTNANWARGFDVVVHNECFGFVQDDAFVENIAAAHRAGVAAVMLHCSTHSYRQARTDEWRKCLGLSSYSHEKGRDLTIKNLRPDHPVMKGFPDVWLDAQDELYKNEKLWPDLVPLAQAYGEETQKDHVVIWLNTYGKGRVFATTLGHGNGTMQSGVYLDLVARGLLWACGKLDENGEPRPGYGASPKR
jgi:type 1 glutamine amidotransferase